MGDGEFLMSTNSTLRERLARLGPVRDADPPPLFSGELVTLVVRRVGRFDKRITVARRLRAAGLTLKAAHNTINRLAEADVAVCTIAEGADIPSLARDLLELDAGKQLTLSDVIAPQLVGHDHPRYILQTLQKPLEEALRGVGIAPGLNEDVEHDAILIDGTPEIVLHASDSDEDLVQVPLVPWPGPAAAQAVSETRAEFLAPASYRLVGDHDAALSQEQLNVPQAEAEHVV